MVPAIYRDKELTTSRVCRDNPHGTGWKLIRQGPQRPDPVDYICGIRIGPFDWVEFQTWESAEGWRADYLRGLTYCDGAWVLGAN